ncbi:MAG: hypothetical protein H6745_04490 [Deltaproteobacteria bacterium]|nr:hypothetical protein [Deltaproteobacteria bacterium]
MTTTRFALTLMLPFATALAACGTLYEEEGPPPDDGEVYVDDQPVDAPLPPPEAGTYDVAEEPPGDAVDDVGVFYAELDDYGTWADEPDVGYVWVPRDTAYQPYSNGYWEYTDFGYTWVSYEPYGWAVCHYGRWLWVGRWVWLPGTEWAPAWVEWRYADDGYVGWAPYGSDRRPPPISAWHFVHRQHLHDRHVHSYYAPREVSHRAYARSRRVDRHARLRSGARYESGPSARWTGHDARPEPVHARDVGRGDRANPPGWRSRSRDGRRPADAGSPPPAGEWRGRRDAAAERQREQEERERAERAQQQRHYETQQRERDAAEARRRADEAQRDALERERREQEERRRFEGERDRKAREERDRRAEEARRQEEMRRAQQERDARERRAREDRRQDELQRKLERQRQEEEKKRAATERRMGEARRAQQERDRREQERRDKAERERRFEAERRQRAEEDRRRADQARRDQMARDRREQEQRKAEQEKKRREEEERRRRELDSRRRRGR